MLSAQKRDLAGKESEASPYPKNDFARWNALDYFTRPGKFQTRRYWVTLATTIGFTLLTVVTLAPGLHRTHQAAPVSTSHAMFNQQCSNCHTGTWAPLARVFGDPNAVSISDKACNECHHGAVHHAKASHNPSCVACHREHTGHDALASHVASRQCTECHRDLKSHLHAGQSTEIFSAITNFNLDHPEFKRSAPGEKDLAKVRFNHMAHLDLTLDDLRHINPETGQDDLKGLGTKLECINCHQLDGERRYFQPIRYEKHCARCHQLTVALIGNFANDLKAKVAEFSKTRLPHKEPAVVRAVLRDRLVEFAQKHALASSGSEQTHVPRPFPWKPSLSVTQEHWSWATAQAKKGEDVLFMNKQWSKAEHLTWCSHCHVEKKPNERVDGLPAYHPTEIPSRWHTRSVFNHGAHRMMGCVECHDRNAAGVKVAHSKSSEDILLPTIETCRECHRPSGSARNACVACHHYHDRSLERDPNGRMGLHDVIRRSR